MMGVSETAEIRYVFSGQDEGLIDRPDIDSIENTSLLEHVTLESNEAKKIGAESREQLGAILDALELVSKLAAIDSATYCTSHFDRGVAYYPKILGIKENVNIKSTGLPSDKDSSKQTVLGAKFKGKKNRNVEILNTNIDSKCHHHQQWYNERENDYENNRYTDSSVSTIQSRLDELQVEWKLEDTPLPNLVSSIHRLQSHLYHANTEADTAMAQVQSLSEDVQSLSEDVVKYKIRNEKLEKATKKLYENNVSLKDKLRETKNSKNRFVKSVKDYVKKKRVEELNKDELHVATRLTVHEKILQMNGACTKSRNGPERSPGAYEFRSLREIVRDEEDATFHSYLGCSQYGEEDKDHYGKNQDFPLIGNRIRTSTSESVYSELDVTFDPVSHQDHEGTSDEPSLQSTDISRMVRNSGESYDPFFDDNRSCSASTWSARSLVTNECMGTVRLDSSSSKLLEVEHNNTSKKNPLFNILTFPQGVDVGLQFQSLPHHKKEEHTIESAFHFDKTSFSRKASKLGETKENIFVVSGYKEFDTTLNAKPAIGEQLIAVGNESLLDKQWTLSDVYEAITKNLLSPSESSESFTLTFRNEPLTKIQKIALDKAITTMKNSEEIVTDETVENRNEEIIEENAASLVMKSSTPSSEEKLCTGKDKSKSSFFELFKSPSTSISAPFSKVETEKKTGLSFFGRTSSNKNENDDFTYMKEDSNSQDFIESTFFDRLNSSKKKSKESLSTLPETEDDSCANNDDDSLSHAKDNIQCDELKERCTNAEEVVLNSEESSPLPKENDSSFFGIFSSKKKKEMVKNEVSKIYGNRIPTSEIAIVNESIMDEETESNQLEIHQNDKKSRTCTVDCKDGEIQIKVQPELTQVQSSEEEGIDVESSDDINQSRVVELDKSDPKFRIGENGNNRSSIKEERKSKEKLPVQTLGLQFISLF